MCFQQVLKLLKSQLMNILACVLQPLAFHNVNANVWVGLEVFIFCL